MAAFILIAFIVAAPFLYLCVGIYVARLVGPIYIPIVVVIFLVLPVFDTLWGTYIVMPHRCAAGGVKVFARIDRDAGLLLHRDQIRDSKPPLISLNNVGFTEEFDAARQNVVLRRADGTVAITRFVEEATPPNAPAKHYALGRKVLDLPPRHGDPPRGERDEVEKHRYGDWGPTYSTQLQSRYEITIGDLGASSAYQSYRAAIIDRASGKVMALVDGHAFLGGFFHAFFNDWRIKTKCHFEDDGMREMMDSVFGRRGPNDVATPERSMDSLR